MLWVDDNLRFRYTYYAWWLVCAYTCAYARNPRRYYWELLGWALALGLTGSVVGLAAEALSLLLTSSPAAFHSSVFVMLCKLLWALPILPVLFVVHVGDGFRHIEEEPLLRWLFDELLRAIMYAYYAFVLYRGLHLADWIARGGVQHALMAHLLVSSANAGQPLLGLPPLCPLASSSHGCARPTHRRLC